MPSKVHTSSHSDRALEIIVVGAGLSGIGAAIECALSKHHVTLLECAAELVEVGAGLQLTPNSTKILKRWGLADSLWASACIPHEVNIHRYSDGALLYSERDYGQKMEDVYGSPFIDVHRADLQLALVDRAKSLGVDFRLGERVVDVDFERSLVTSESGRTFQGDLVVGADGLWSRCREFFLKKQDKPNPTGDLAYRIILNSKDIPDDDLREIVTKPSVNFWFGPGGHVVSYSVRSTDMFNIVFMYPDDLPADVSRRESSMEEMRALFRSWDPILSRFLGLVKHVEKWKLMHRPEMESWINEEANFALIGDACHPMLPYLAQGANSAVEDGSVLGLLLGKIESKGQLPQALKMYERLRKARGETIAKESFKQREIFHLTDGPQQEARDALLISSSGKPVTEKFPIRWVCPEVQPWLFGYDAQEEVEKALALDPFTKTSV